MINSLKNIIYVLKVAKVKVQEKKQYEIKKGYFHRKSYSYFDNLENTDKWQNEVYLKAREYYDTHNLKVIVDMGCGSAYKLIKHFKDSKTIGIDVSPTYETLLEKYPDRKWLKVGATDLTSLNANLVICSDVIEHVLDPNQLLDDIKKIKSIKYVILSTPDRLLIPHATVYGPPENKTHIREWSFAEFNEYISEHFDILKHYISNKKQFTQ